MQEYLPLGRFSAVEEQGFEALKPELQASIKKGVDFVVYGERAWCNAAHALTIYPSC